MFLAVAPRPQTPAPNAPGRAGQIVLALVESLLVAVRCPPSRSVFRVARCVARDALQRTEPPSLTTLQCGIGALVGRLLGALDEVLPWRVRLRLALAWDGMSVFGSRLLG